MKSCLFSNTYFLPMSTERSLKLDTLNNNEDPSHLILFSKYYSSLKEINVHNEAGTSFVPKTRKCLRTKRVMFKKTYKPSEKGSVSQN